MGQYSNLLKKYLKQKKNKKHVLIINLLVILNILMSWMMELCKLSVCQCSFFYMVFGQKYFAIIHRFFFVEKIDDSVIDMIIRIIKEKKNIVISDNFTFRSQWSRYSDFCSKSLVENLGGKNMHVHNFFFGVTKKIMNLFLIVHIYMKKNWTKKYIKHFLNKIDVSGPLLLLGGCHSSI